jgi:rhamnogalacturonyl hydrolase YesR
MNAVTDPRAVKATNATAFAATLALKLYQINHKPQYFDFGKRLYHWNRSFMQDPIDKMYWNDISLLTHQINKTKWTYNVGEMLSSSCLLYKITKDSSYLNEAKELAKKSFDYFSENFKDNGRFFPNHDPWFTMILLRGYLDLYALDKNAEYINTIIKNADYAWMHARTADGLFYEDWAGDNKGRYYWILNQECMVEVYALISKFKNE